MFSMEVTQLIERCRQGDADALGELYKTYAQRMRGVCRRYVSDEETISDVLHDSFVIIFTSFDKLRDDRKAEAWMMSIMRNVASKYKDHLAKMTFVQLEDAEQLQAPEVENEVRGVPLEDVMQLVDLFRKATVRYSDSLCSKGCRTRRLPTCWASSRIHHHRNWQGQRRCYAR